MAALQALWGQVQADDACLQAGEASASAREVLARMEQSLSRIRAQSSSLPEEQCQTAIRKCAEYEDRLKRHRTMLQSRAEAGARDQLFERRGDRETSSQQRPESQEENDRSEVAALAQARDEMRSQLTRMEGVGGTLDNTSRTIGKTQTQYETYSARLASASKVLGDLKRKTEEDAKYIWWSFYFFIAVVVYIFLKRLKVFKILYWSATWTWWSGGQAANLVGQGAGLLGEGASLMQTAWLQFQAGYAGFCELLGIPSAFDVEVESLQ